MFHHWIYASACRAAFSDLRFESSVNPEGYETKLIGVIASVEFESSVNPEGYETMQDLLLAVKMFESSVNPEGYETTIFD